MQLIRQNISFRALFVSSLFTMLGTSLLNIVFLIYASSFDQSTFYVSLAEFFILAPVFLAIYTGFLADKTVKKASKMIASSWVQALLYFLIALLFLSGKNLGLFLAIGGAKALCDFISGYKNGLRAPILQRNVKNNEISSAFGQLQVLSSLAELVGQPLGVMILTMTKQSFYLVGCVNGLLFILSGAVLYFNRQHLTGEVGKINKKSHLNLRKTFAQIRLVFTVESKNSNFVLILLSVILLNFLFAGIGPLTDLSLISGQKFGMSYSVAVLIFNLSLSAGMLLGSLWMKDFLKKLTLQKLFVLIFALIALFAVTLSNLAGLALFLIFVLAYTVAKASPKVNSLIMENISSQDLGKISGGITTLFTFSIPFGGAFFIFLANLIGVRLTLDLIALLGLCFFIRGILARKT